MVFSIWLFIVDTSGINGSNFFKINTEVSEI